ncbi:MULTISPECIES: gluconate 2-dehydrogenase subunit 3 family protein [unclassified Mesorhizobium]|uniref:gluconate 2-dehydrogenase subunit 3 family protein n=1 Tax=unclassified Mesorhizobium TaxID=325217 RepID=UPI00112B3430|nr:MULTISPECIES: gluconate 2-dehydrogenase subunit 3 family protein [unclassified Mesorhizobium]MBZ9974283.1 gluconate 2-dehydrogenase subunit 3 family protein [Mesorhizobium sp. BR-1-1-10]TPK10228.1 gluconate 2-dehydrogenase subunit 3 family protein [Mesorhizobium sp. B2-5-7]
MKPNLLSRRRFLTAGATVAASATIGAASARDVKGGDADRWLPHQADAPNPLDAADYKFFTADEAAFVEAATERLIPEDALGPGARGCGVPLFIDHQLAGAYGRGGSWYMQGPWDKGEDTQGYQSRMTPSALYRAAIAAIDQHAVASQGGRRFAELAPEAQDALLSDLEKGKVDLGGVDAKTFFKMLWLNTKEGMFSDPIYGGNKDMAGWKMLGFPGARYNYLDWVDRHGDRYDQPPVGIRGRPAWDSKG